MITFFITHTAAAQPATTAASKSKAASSGGGLPDSIKRMDQATSFPNEYPGQIYAFNWCLNGDGVTPLRKSAFRITKPLDLKVANLAVPSTMPLKVCPYLWTEALRYYILRFKDSIYFDFCSVIQCLFRCFYMNQLPIFYSHVNSLFLVVVLNVGQSGPCLFHARSRLGHVDV